MIPHPEFHTIAIAGTFDRLHKGHRYFISEAFKFGTKVIIGITSDKYAKAKFSIFNFQFSNNIQILNFQTRRSELEYFLKQERLSGRAEIVKIDDVYGPTLERNDIEALVVTQETKDGASQVNKKREEMGLSPLKIIILPLIMAQDNVRIASTRIRRGEIDRWGRAFAKQMQITNDKFQISNELRQELKKPLGELIKGNPNNLSGISEKLKKAIGKTRRTMIITVGDEVTKLCNEIGITIDLAIFDYRVGREEKYHSLSDLGFKSTFARVPLANGLVTVRNPAGHITNELVDVVKNAYLVVFKDGKQRIIQVNGEEDLAGVPAMLLAPLGSLVLYGQPGEGVVVVEVTEEKKDALLRLITLNQST